MERRLCSCPIGSRQTHIAFSDSQRRLCEWNRSNRAGVPVFYALNDPREVYGVLVVLSTENLNGDRTLPAGAFSVYWKTLDGTVSGDSDSLRDVLGSRLQKAIRKNVINCRYMDGGIRYSVAYAVFESTEETSGSLRHTAEHEASHAIVAVKSGLGVTGISLLEEGPLRGGVVCNWKANRYSMPDEQLIISSLALAYAGAVIEMERTGKGIGETIDVLKWDRAAIEDSRRTAVEWQISTSTEETGPLSEAGLDLAISLITEYRELVQELADELMVKISLDEQEFSEWCAASAV